ncbi:hypothetical protein B0J13DRAFT_525819 [Dactylonectria estremocensis]|uniref:Uncharacterized protein n=1 Tax=Dactylonectria estremocensis TaxID=1079267 RepID=A0A9P9EU23_9HYPO|nr:hypothetical protein B0J13DRAFT_525819 [Dactylonectria estremocensis]
MPTFPLPLQPHGFEEGCWHTDYPKGDGNAMKNLLFMLPRLYWKGDIDCDCHMRGLCMPGEPPLPPMFEFKNDPDLNPNWKPSKPKHVNSKPPNSHTWRPNHWSTNPLRKGPHDKNPKLPPIVSHWKRDDFGVEPNLLKWEPILHREDPPYEGVTIPGPWGYRASVIRAFHKLPVKKQLVVMAKWPDFKMHTEGIHLAINFNYTEFDPRPSLAILLGDPRGWAGSAVQAMDQRNANLLLHCTDAAMLNMLNKTMQEIIDNAPSTHNPNGDRAKNERRKALTAKRLGYYEVLKHYAVLLEHATPASLSRGQHGHERFSFESKLYLPEKLQHKTDTLQNKTQAVEFVTISINDICEAVNTEAFSNVGTEGSFVSDFENTMRALDQHVKLGQNNTVMDAMKLPLTLETMGADLDWSPQALPKIFEESYQSVQLGLSYLTLSLWLGIGR